MSGLDLTWTPAEDAFRAEAQEWLETNLAAWHAEHGGEEAIASGDMDVVLAVSASRTRSKSTTSSSPRRSLMRR